MQRQVGWLGWGLLGCPLDWDPSGPHYFGTANSHRTQLPALRGVCAKNPPSWAMSLAGKMGGQEAYLARGLLDGCWPCRRNCTGPLLISANPLPEAGGHWPPVPAPQAQISTPALAEVSVSHQTLPLSCDNGLLLPHFPHLENVCRSTHHLIVLYKSLGGFINTGNVQTSFCCFS